MTIFEILYILQVESCSLYYESKRYPDMFNECKRLYLIEYTEMCEVRFSEWAETTRYRLNFAGRWKLHYLLAEGHLRKL